MCIHTHKIFYHVDARDQNQIIRLGSRGLYSSQLPCCFSVATLYVLRTGSSVRKLASSLTAHTGFPASPEST